jgi:hypothetical protein
MLWGPAAYLLTLPLMQDGATIFCCLSPLCSLLRAGLPAAAGIAVARSHKALPTMSVVPPWGHCGPLCAVALSKDDAGIVEIQTPAVYKALPRPS